MAEHDQPAGNQPEFWMTVKENGVYPTLEEELTVKSFYQFSNYESQLLTPEQQEVRENRARRFYARKLTNVRFAETIGNQSLDYTETDEYEHVFILDIRHQPEEGDILICMRIGSKLFCFGTANRGYGGTFDPPATFRGRLKIKDSYIHSVGGDLYGRLVGRYYPSVHGSQPTSLKFVMTSGPSSVPDTTTAVPVDNYYLLLHFDTGFYLGDDTGDGYRFDVYGVLGATEEIIAESLAVGVPDPYNGPYGGYFRPYNPPVF